ncbi:MAG: hypothetical protein WCJ58_04190 [bacterium]
MKYIELKKFKNLLYINRQIAAALFPKDTAGNITIRFSQLAKSGKLIRLKRDIYIFTDQYQELKRYPEYLAVLACIIKQPAYLSLDYVLRKYEILSEATYGFTLVTLKKRSLITNKIGIFSYNQIAVELFTGYQAKTFLEFEYYEASKAKALFDWIYYRIGQIQFERVGINLVEDLRLNLESFQQSDFQELSSYIDLCKPQEKMKIIINNLIKHAYYH